MDGSFPSNPPPHGLGGGGFDASGSALQRRGFRGNEQNAKTKICMRWKGGTCRFGSNCNFAHGEEELRRLPPRGDVYGGGLGRGRGGFAGGGFDTGFGEQGFPQPRGPGVTGSYGAGYGAVPGAAGADYYGRPAGGGFAGAYDAGGAGAGTVSYGGVVARAGGLLGGGSGVSSSEEAWRAQGCPVPGSDNWTQYRCKDTGEPYYHQAGTDNTVWEPPPGWHALGQPPGGGFPAP